MNFNPQDVKRVPGTLIMNPTNLAAAYPYGGTVLGVVRSIEIDLGLRVRQVIDEGGGGGTIETLKLGQASALHAVLASWDNDMVQAVFPNSSSFEGFPHQLNREDGTGVEKPGGFGSADAIALLFAPRAPLHHPAFLLYRAFPFAQEAARMSMNLTKEIGVAVSFLGLPNDSHTRHALDLLENISL